MSQSRAQEKDLKASSLFRNGRDDGYLEVSLGMGLEGWVGLEPSRTVVFHGHFPVMVRQETIASLRLDWLHTWGAETVPSLRFCS